MQKYIITCSVFGNGNQYFIKHITNFRSLNKQQKREFLDYIKRKTPELRAIPVYPNERVKTLLKGEDYCNYWVLNFPE